MKRKERRQLKENDLLVSIKKLVNFVSRNKNKFIGAVIVIMVVIVVFIGIRVIKSYSQKKEARLLTDLFEMRSEIDSNPEAIYKIKELAGNGKYSRVAYIILAGYWIEKSDFDKAENLLKKIKKNKKDIFYYQSQDLLAQIYHKQKKYDKAIEIYKRIEEEKPKEYVLDIILFRHAQAHEEKGEIEEALLLYKEIKEEYSQTYYGYDASRKIEQLQKNF
jgi:predicted negative regulator of RcsB-dependent stress response